MFGIKGLGWIEGGLNPEPGGRRATRMADDLGAGLDQLLALLRQRPLFHRLGHVRRHKSEKPFDNAESEIAEDQ